MANKITGLKDKAVDKYRSKIRERAITQAKAKIALAGRKVEDYSPEDLEVIVLNEEEKVKRSMKTSGLVVILIALGLG
jgi:uncharacterized protein YaaQ